MFCRHCGKEIANDAAFCAYCGKSTQTTAASQPFAQPFPQQVVVQQVVQVDPNDAPDFGMAVLGFFIPIAGIILYAVNQNTKPLSAKSALKGALAGIISSVVVVPLLYLLIVGGLLTASMPY